MPAGQPPVKVLVASKGSLAATGASVGIENLSRSAEAEYIRILAATPSFDVELQALRAFPSAVNNACEDVEPTSGLPSKRRRLPRKPGRGDHRRGRPRGPRGRQQGDQRPKGYKSKGRSLLCKYLFLFRPFLWLRGPSPPPLSQTPIKEEDAAHTLSVSSCFSHPCLRVPVCPNSRLCFLECPEGASSRDAGTQGTSSRVAGTQADDQLIPELVHPCMFCLTALKKF